MVRFAFVQTIGNELFHDGGRYHTETSPLICGANKWTGFYMITASVMKELNKKTVKYNYPVARLEDLLESMYLAATLFVTDLRQV